MSSIAARMRQDYPAHNRDVPVHLVLVLALAVGEGKGLQEYMRALQAADARWRAITELVIQDRIEEARRLAAEPLDPVLGDDWKSLHAEFGQLPRLTVDPVDRPLELAHWAARRGRHQEAERFFREAQQRGAELREADLQSWFSACFAAANWTCATQLMALEPVKGRYGASRGAELEALAAGRLSVSESLALRTRQPSFHGPALALQTWAWRPATKAERAQRLELLADQLPEEGQRLAKLVLAGSRDAGTAQSAAALAELAGSTKDPEQAFRLWQELSTRTVPQETLATALSRMAAIRQRQDRYPEAVALYRKVLALGTLPRTRTVPVESTLQSAAALQIGHTLLESGDAAAALVAYREAETKYPFQSFWERPHAWPYALYQGLALERLGRTGEAAGEYAFALFEAPLWWEVPLAEHLMDLYAVSGHTEALDAFLAGPPGHYYQSRIPVLTLRLIRRLEGERDWASLIEHLRRGPERRGFVVDERDGYASPALSRALTRHCKDTVAPLQAALDPSRGRSWIVHTLGRCGTGPAITTLSALLESRDDRHLAVEGLALTAAGREVLTSRGIALPGPVTYRSPVEDTYPDLGFPDPKPAPLPVPLKAASRPEAEGRIRPAVRR
jgi:tetratricopeptide (TPR) repeat protein